MKQILILTSVAVALATPVFGADEAVLASYTKHCVACHGKDGKGQTTMGKKSGVKDYSDPKVAAEVKDDEALKAVKEGLKDKAGKELMKPFSAKLSDDEIKALIAHLKSFGKK